MRILGVEFAPFSIPLHRRMETASVFTFFASAVYGGPLLTIYLFYLLFFTSWYFIPLLYFSWMFYDRQTCHRGGRGPWKLMRENPLTKSVRDYFPITLEKTVELDPKKNYIFGYHPHGVIAAGAIIALGSNALQVDKLLPGIKLRFAILSGWFRIPFTRELMLTSGCCSVNKESLDRMLSQGPGSAVIIPVGGAAEVLEAHPNTVHLVLKNRKGFVKRAIENGASLVPVFGFGENDIYSQVANPPGSVLRYVQEYLKKVIGFYPPLIYGRGFLQYSFGIVPYRKPIRVLVGKPIDVTRKANPDHDEIDQVHHQYLKGIQQLFEENKARYGQSDINMKFI